MGYRASWNATDQVPQRLIDAGTFDGRPFGRFDAVDTSDGGDTARTSLSGEWHRQGAAGTTRVSAFAMHCQLALFSNFTYSLDRPDTGDQFSQQDRRDVFGLRASHAFDHALGGLATRSEVGLSLRHDRIRVSLFDTQARQVTATTRDDRVHETAAGVWGQTALELAPWLRVIGGLRADTLRNRVASLLPDGGSGSASATKLSPKLSAVVGPFERTEFFVNAGRGFHSNDARGTTEAVDAAPPIVQSTGYELGARTEALPGLQSSLALWKLDFDSELVYVGDAGSTEASAASRRRGVEWNNRWVPLSWFLFDADLAWTHARFADGDRIPNAVDRVASVAATLRDIGPWSAGLNWRYLGSGALIEDNSVRSRSSLTTNLRLGWKPDRRFEATLDVFNLGNRKVDDIQYYYESQLAGEAAPVADRHVHPAEPRSLRLTLRVAL